MSKKYLILFLIFSLFINIQFLNINAGTMDENIDDFYFYSGDGEHTLYTGFYYPIDLSKDVLGIYIPYTEYSSVMNDDTYIFQSLLRLYNSDYLPITQIDLNPFLLEENNGVLIFDNITHSEIWDYEYFKLELIQIYGNSADPVYLNWFNERFDWGFFDTTDEALWLNYYSSGYQFSYYVGSELWYQNYYEVNGTPDEPIEPNIENFEFLGWWIFNGIDYDYYDFDPIDFDFYSADNVTLTAQFKFSPIIGGIGDYDNTPSALETLLTITGLNNTVGKIIIYIIVLILTVIVMVWIKLELFIIILVEIVLFGFFIFLGWIPVYMMIILGLIYAIAMIKTVTKGG